MSPKWSGARRTPVYGVGGGAAAGGVVAELVHRRAARREEHRVARDGELPGRLDRIVQDFLELARGYEVREFVRGQTTSSYLLIHESRP